MPQRSSLPEQTPTKLPWGSPNPHIFFILIFLYSKYITVHNDNDPPNNRANPHQYRRLSFYKFTLMFLCVEKFDVICVWLSNILRSYLKVQLPINPEQKNMFPKAGPKWLSVLIWTSKNMKRKLLRCFPPTRLNFHLNTYISWNSLF